MTREKNIIICPVYNEENTLEKFFLNLRKYYNQDVLFIDDGSTDRGREWLLKAKNKHTFLIRHPERNGYGAALLSGFKFSINNDYKKIITLDVDLQHNPKHIPYFLTELNEKEVIIGSRYMFIDKHPKAPQNIPFARLTINIFITKLINHLFLTNFTDSFSGFRGYRDSFLKKIYLNEPGYGLGLEIILEIIRTKTSFRDIPIEIIYNNHLRKFFDDLDDPRKRLLYYLDIIYSKKKELEDDLISKNALSYN